MTRDAAARTCLRTASGSAAVAARGLRLLRDRLGDRFAYGFVLNLGDLAYRKEDRISVLPLCRLWN